RRLRELLGTQADAVDVFAGQPPSSGDDLRADALWNKPAGVTVVYRLREWEPEAAPEGCSHRDACHVFNTRRDDQIHRARHPGLRGEVSGLLRRTALTVDGRRRHVIRQARCEPAVAADVDRLLADL